MNHNHDERIRFSTLCPACKVVRGTTAETVKPGVYKHFKGNFYEVIGVAKHTETGEPLVVYRPLYSSDVDLYVLYVRPLAMFQDQVEGVPRFDLIKEVRRHRLSVDELLK